MCVGSAEFVTTLGSRAFGDNSRERQAGFPTMGKPLDLGGFGGDKAALELGFGACWDD